MVVLNNGARRRVWKRFQDDVGKRDRTLSITKGELRAAIDQADDWVDSNLNGAIAAVTGGPATDLIRSEKIELLTAIFIERRRRAVGP